MRSILTVVEGTDTPEIDLISLEDLKAALGITTTSEDASLAILITTESALISAYFGFALGLTDLVETFTFDTLETWLPRQPLVLSRYPIVEVTSVVSGGSELGEDDYALDARKGLLWLGNGAWGATAEVTYSAGWDLPEGADARLVAAVIEAVRQRRISVRRDPSVRATSHGDTRVDFFSEQTITGGLPSSVIGILSTMKRISV